MRRLRFWTNLLLFTLPLLLLLIGATNYIRHIANFLTLGKRLGYLVSVIATEQAGQAVTVGNVAIRGDFWNRDAENSIVLSHITLSDKQKPQSLLGRAEEVTLDYKLNQFFDDPATLRPVLNQITVRNPELNLSRDAKGQLNLLPMLQNLLGGKPKSKRTGVSRVVVEGGTLNYKDAKLPHPKGVPASPFATTLHRVDAVVQIRPNKSVLFDVKSKGWEGIAEAFHAVGVVAPDPTEIEANVEVFGLELNKVGKRILPASEAVVTQGKADIALTAHYSAPLHKRTFDPNALQAFAKLNLKGVSANGKRIEAPIANASGTAFLTPTTLQGSLSGNYAGTPVRAQGSIHNLTLFAPTKTVPNYEVQGRLTGLTTQTLLHYPVLANFLQTKQPTLQRELLKLEGKGDVLVASSGTFKNASVSTHWNLPTLTNHTTTLQDVKAGLVYSEGKLQFQLHAHSGKQKVIFKTQTQRDLALLSLEGRDILLEKLAPYWAEVKSVPSLSGTVQVSANFQKRPQAPWKSLLSAQASKLQVNGQNFHTIHLEADSIGERFHLQNLLIEDPRGFVTAQGDINSKTHELDIRFAGDELDIGSINPILSSFNPKNGSNDKERERTDFPIEGIAYLRGDADMGARISGTWDNPTVAGRLTAFNVRVGKFESERVEGVVNASRDRVVVRQGNVLLTPGFITFSALIDGLGNMESKPPTVAVTAQVEKMNLSRLLTMAGVQASRAPLTGSLSTGEISLTGTTKDIQTRTPAHITLNNLTVGDLPLVRTEIDLSLRDKTAIIEKAVAEIAQGAITAQGTLANDGTLKLNIGAEKLDIASLLAPYQTSEDLTTLQGKLFARASVSGKIDDPAANLHLQATDLQYQTYPFGLLNVAANYRQRNVVVENATLGELGSTEGRVYLSGLNYDIDKKSIEGKAGWTGISVMGIRDFLTRISGEAQSTRKPTTKEATFPLLAVANGLSPLEGTTSGTLEIGGTSELPTVVINWDETPFTIDRYPITLNAGRGTLTKTAATFPRISLTAQEGAVDITANKIEYEGDIDATLTTYDLNLAFLSRWLHLPERAPANPQSPTELERWLALTGTPDIQGRGSISLSLKGKTNSPDIEQGSVNLSKIDIGKLLSDKTRNSLLAIDKFDINDITLKDGVVRSDGIAVRYQDTVLRGTASLEGFQWTNPFVPPTAKIRTSAQLVPRSDDEQNLQSLARFLPNLLHKASTGRLELSLQTEGTQKDPLQDVRGKMHLTAKRLQLAQIATGLAQVEGQFEMAEGDLIVKSFAGKTQIFRDSEFAKKSTGSSVLLSGRLPLGITEGSAPRLDGGLQLSVDKIAFEEAPFPGAATGAARGQALVDMRVTGSLKAPLLSGKMVLSNTQFALPSEFLASASTAERLPAYPQFNLSFIAGSDVRLINQMMDTKVVGTLTAQGSPAEPHLEGRLNLLGGGHLRMVTTRMSLLTPSFITLKYPVSVGGEETLALDVSLRAEANLIRNSNFSAGTERERTLLRIEGPLTGVVVDPVTGESKLRVSSTDPRINSQTFLQSLLLGDPTQLDRFGSSPGQVLTQQLASAFTGAVLPDIFDKPAEQLGLRDLSLTFDPIRNVTLNLSRNLFGPVYISYSRSLSSAHDLFTFRTSLRIKDRYQATYEIREQNEQRILAEGIFRW